MTAIGIGIGVSKRAIQQLGGGGGPVYDADAQRLFNKFATDPGATRKQLISERYVAGKQKSFWAKLDALWVHAAHGPEAGRLDWIDSFGDRRYDCLPVSSPAFTVDRGYMGDGLVSYLDTQFNPSTAISPKMTQNSGSMGIRSNTDNAADGSLAGFYDGTRSPPSGVTLNPRTSGGAFGGRMHSNTGPDIGNGNSTSSRGMFHVNRVGAGADAASVQLYRNGASVPIVTFGSASVSPSNGNIRLGSISNTSYRACQFSMGWVGAGLTDQEALDLFNWFEPYRAAVGVT